MGNPPSIINSLIAMGMWQEDPSPMFGMGIVRLLMSLTMLTVPVMLFPKPLLLAMRHSAQNRHSARGHRQEDEEALCVQTGELIREEFELGEVVIHLVIETIEYVLGT